MARTKRTSAVSEAAKLRLAGLQSIDPLLDLGGGLTAASFKADIDDVDADFNTYNTMLSDVDQFQNRLGTKETMKSTCQACDIAILRYAVELLPSESEYRKPGTDFQQNTLRRVEDFGCRTGVLGICADVPDRLKDACDETKTCSKDFLVNGKWAVYRT